VSRGRRFEKEVRPAHEERMQAAEEGSKPVKEAKSC
jgi:hypothetical protein